MNRFLLLLFFSCPSLLYAQSQLSGRVLQGQQPLTGAHVQVKGSNTGTSSTANGSYQLSLPAGTHLLRVSFLGFKPLEVLVVLGEKEQKKLDFKLEADLHGLEQVVVSANREEVSRREAPVRVEVIDSKRMQQLQAPALADGLSFSPGVRTENNCQNCGFSAVRLNGLPGAYTQILIDGRPVFSALNGVYGLDQIPAAMIERTEVVRGGGSVLYGGNAIAGTVNIITRTPVANGFSVWQQSSLIGGKSPENNTQFHFDLVDEKDQKAGISFYGSLRNRAYYDHNNDQFSDITALQGQTIGANAFVNLHKRLQLRTNAYHLQEFRRGGSDFELKPHQARLTEQLEHRVNGLRTELSYFSKNYRNKLTLYNSSQFTQRLSYYGGGGRVLQAGDSLTAQDLLALNAYGQANDRSVVSGINWQRYHSDKLLLTAGTEYWFNSIEDRMPGYQRLLDQRYQVWGNFTQAEYQLSKRVKVLGGLRYDLVRLAGQYDLATDVFQQDQSYGLLLPRLSSMINFNPKTQLRLSWAQGYRAPQAFDEDLHIELLGGAARFVRLGNDLVPERSNSFSATLQRESSIQHTGLLSSVELFYTQLQNPFLLLDAEVLPSGLQVVNKRNGSGARVFGFNLSTEAVFENSARLQFGLTGQQALLNEAEVLWESASGDSITTTNRLLRTPNWYGYANFRQPFAKDWAIQANLQLTGAMLVPHVIEPESAYTVTKTTPNFADLALFVEKQWVLAPRLRLESSVGIQNLFNSFQRDLDTGPDRDAGYVYGPMRPRTLLLSIRLAY
ncbi:MAG: TonB-dependent receptor [Sphingobacteriaceae bacterium]|nr:TonB-dependent receptor [Sphingobacteriaceae bacterium]